MRLLGTEKLDALTHKYWLHSGDDGKDRITVQTTQDVTPVINRVKNMAGRGDRAGFRHVATIPSTIIDEICRVEAQRRNARAGDVFTELVGNKTRWAIGVWENLTQGRDYRKLQGKHYVA